MHVLCAGEGVGGDGAGFTIAFSVHVREAYARRLVDKEEVRYGGPAIFVVSCAVAAGVD